jgi:hypothetical protein
MPTVVVKRRVMPRQLARHGVFMGLLLAALILASCGGDGDSTPEPTTTLTPTITLTPSLYSAPTWTPVPTSTPVPVATIEYTYVPPAVGTRVYLPSPPPTEIPPTFDPLAATAEAAAALLPGGPVAASALLFADTQVTEAAGEALEPVVGSFVAAPPDVAFADDGTVVVMMDAMVSTADGRVPREVIMTARAEADRGEIRLVMQSANFADDDSPYTDAIGGFVLSTVDSALNTMLQDRYRQSHPGGGSFIVIDVRVTEGRLIARTRAVTGTD